MSETKPQRDRAIHSLEQIELEMKKLGGDWEPKLLNEKIDLDVNTSNGRVTFQIAWNSSVDVLELFKAIASQGGKSSIGTKHALEGIDIQSVIAEIKSNL